LAKFPEPPGAQQLRNVPVAEKTLAAGTVLWRVYRRGGPHPCLWQGFRYYGPLNGRFDHHLLDDDGQPRLQDRGIYYAALDIRTALAESFQDTRIVHRTASDQPWIVGFELADSVRLLDLTGGWPTRAGASMVINSGPRPRARRWSIAIYETYPELQGLLSASSMYANRPMVSLYERAATALPARPAVHRPLNDPALLVGLERVAVAIGYDLI
jgi:RES domain